MLSLLKLFFLNDVILNPLNLLFDCFLVLNLIFIEFLWTPRWLSDSLITIFSLRREHLSYWWLESAFFIKPYLFLLLMHCFNELAFLRLSLSLSIQLVKDIWLPLVDPSYLTQNPLMKTLNISIRYQKQRVNIGILFTLLLLYLMDQVLRQLRVFCLEVSTTLGPFLAALAFFASTRGVVLRMFAKTDRL